MSSLASFQNIHKGETIIVCGCGESLNDLKHPERFITIGVNDVGRRFDPTYLVVLNPRKQFKNGRFRYVETSRAKAIFTQLNLGINHPNTVRFKLGKRGGTDFSDSNTLPYTQNSPYVAVCLAAHMGAKHIGFIGVDFADNHFFGKTGRHVLNGKLASIDQEYRDLEKGLSNAGIKVFNLSRQSKITAFEKMSIEDFYKLAANGESVESKSPSKEQRIFFVNYKFLSCGDVFRTGLNHAAADLGITSAESYWDDPNLREKISQFNPGLVFVVHGRKFTRRWGKRFKSHNTAVWLLDEPYEVDDTSKFSVNFDTVFVNDANTIHRHWNAHYLPVCYDHHGYSPTSTTNNYEVGFIGGYNNVRQKILERLYNNGLLSYVIGGPWKGGNLNRICLSPNIPAHEVAGFYRQTKIVVNIFREVHHFNKQKIQGFSLNPRAYEALACGALVVSEDREEINKVFPEMPVFENSEQLVEIVKELLNDKTKYETVRTDCYKRLNGHTYLNRLKKIIHITLEEKNGKHQSEQANLPSEDVIRDKQITGKPVSIYNDWEDYGNVVEADENGTLILKKMNDNRPGAERGLVSKKRYSNVRLSFEVNIKSTSCFIAKIHQVDKFDQTTNSYHLMCEERRSYLARHHHIFTKLNMGRNSWEKIEIVFKYGTIYFYKNEHFVLSFKDQLLKRGYAFIGLKAGQVLLRNVAITPSKEQNIQDNQGHTNGRIDYEVLHYFAKPSVPIVSIITTVYDRVECLKNCIESVKNSEFKDYEHIIVADSPPEEVIKKLKELLKHEDNGQIEFVNLGKRYNNWGITPASVGIRLSNGRYISFLSDDNGYAPDHVGTLVEALESNPNLGFVYSSCRYDARLVLNSPVPRPGRIDLGQPMFQRELFKLHFQDTLPFKTLPWDWHMIDHFMKKGVRWKHINKPSFLFKLSKYPEFMVSKNRQNALVTISVLCHNNLKYTIKCVESILAETRPEFELLITDNDSSDNTYEYLQSINDPRVKVSRNDKNVGFPAHNAALEKAKGAYFLVLNNDVMVKGSWLEKIMHGFGDPTVRIVGPVACKLDSQGCGYEENSGDYDYIEGCCLAIRTDFAREIGLFGNEFEFMYCEDSDLSLRVRAMGYKIKKVDCEVHHAKGVTANQCTNLDIHGYWIKNHYLLRKKWIKYLETRSFKKEIYIKRMGAIGDVLLLSPVIEYLKKENVHLRINVVSQSPQLLEGNPLIERIWKLPPRHAEILDLDGAYERRPRMHIVDAFVEEVGIRVKINRQPRIYLNNDDSKWAHEHCKGEYVVVHAGPTHWPSRDIPIPTLVRVVEMLRKRGHKIVEIGHVRNLPNVDEDFIGSLWKHTAVVIRNSMAFIGTDSAPMHIAQAFNKPGAVVFGGINPYYRLVNPEILRPVLAEVGCKFCHHWRSAPRIFSDCLRNDPECMNMITPDQIIEQFDKAMEIALKTGPKTTYR